MHTIQVQLPDPLGTFVKEQAARAGMVSESDYVQKIVEQEMERQQKGELYENLRQGMQSKSTPMLDKDWQELRILAKYGRS